MRHHWRTYPSPRSRQNRSIIDRRAWPAPTSNFFTLTEFNSATLTEAAPCGSKDLVNARYASQPHHLKPIKSAPVNIAHDDAKTRHVPDSNLRAFLKDESAATAVEYALIGAFVALAIIVSVSTLGGRLSIRYNTVASDLS
jgi:pilus assembly protein Flp/PilA